jgi:hypothetical protein
LWRKGTTIGQPQPFEDKYYVETLKIPQDILDSSITVDDVEFAAALATKIKWKATSKLAQKLQRNHSS